MKLVWTEEAIADLGRIRTFLRPLDEKLADRAIATLLGTLQPLEVFPGRGRPSTLPGARELFVPFGQSGYVVRYIHLSTSDEILIVRLWHGREDRR